MIADKGNLKIYKYIVRTLYGNNFVKFSICNAIEHWTSTLTRVEHGKSLIPSLFPQNMHI